MTDILNKNESKKSNDFCSKKNIWWWVLIIFCILVFVFLITILVLVVVNFTRDNSIQSQMQPTSLLQSIRKGLDSYMGNDIGILNNKISFCFSKIYKLNPDIQLHISDTLHNYFKQKFIEINDPSEYLFNNQNKLYINKGRIDIYNKEDDIEQKNPVIYSISTNLPYFSAIKFVQFGIDPLDQTSSIKHTYNLCTNELKADDSRKCHRNIGKHVLNNYNNTIYENIIQQQQDLYSTIHLLVIFINENDLSQNLITKDKKNKQQQQPLQHKNSIGDIAFVLNLDRC